MGKWIRRVIMLVLLAVFLYSAGTVAVILYQYHVTDELYADIASQYTGQGGGSSAQDTEKDEPEPAGAGADNSSDTRREVAPITVDFEGRMVEYSPDMLAELEPAYAVTVHKSQGSEYRAVVLTALDTAPRLLTRGVLYTAITRARELLVIVGDENVIARMTANNRQTKRYSGLRWRLAEGEKPL